MHERGPEKNGLFWSTYNAAVRRDGVYTSKSFGAIDFNQELCDPMEKEFSSDWQSTMDATIKSLLANVESKLLVLADAVNQAIASGFAQEVDTSRLSLTAGRSCATALKAAFHQMRGFASDAQRDLN